MLPSGKPSRMHSSPSTPRLVLLAEDDALISLDIQDELERAGHSVAGPFSTCAEAMRWLETNTPNIAVLDIQLRDGACVELARELMRLKVPFAVYSGEFQSATLPEFKDAKWISKPARPQSLLKALAELPRLVGRTRVAT